MDPGLSSIPKKKAAPEGSWQSLLCLRPRRQKKKVLYATYIHRLLSQTESPGASCLVTATLGWLESPGLLGAVALEAARLSLCARRRRQLGPREVLLATKLVLLCELSKIHKL